VKERSVAIYVEAVHRVTPFRPDVLERWFRFYNDDAIPAMRRHGYQTVGAWRLLTGGAGEDLIVNRFASMAAFEEASANLFADPAIAAGSAAVRADVPDFAVAEVVKLGLSPPQLSDAQIEAQLQSARHAGPAGSYYDLQVRSRAASIPALVERLLQNGTGTTSGPTLFAVYQTRIGLRDEVTSLWRVPKHDLGAQPALGLGIFGGELAREERVDLMLPLPYSPLQ